MKLGKGVRFISRFRQRSEFNGKMITIAVIAFTQTGDEHRFREAGCTDHISRTFKKK